MKSLKTLIGMRVILKELPQLRFDTPSLTVGNGYKIDDVDDSNLIFKDDNGEKTSIGSCRFILPNIWIHPEQKDGEVFIINVRDNENMFSDGKIFKETRRGKIAYTTNGKEIVPNMKPLFGKYRNR